NGDQFTIPLAGIKSIEIRTGAGADVINIQDVPSTVAVQVYAGTGKDVINLGAPNVLFGAQFSLDGIKGSVTVAGEGGSADELYLLDSFNNANDTYTVPPGTVTRSGIASVSYSTVEKVTINAGG